MQIVKEIFRMYRLENDCPTLSRYDVHDTPENKRKLSDL